MIQEHLLKIIKASNFRIFRVKCSLGFGFTWKNHIHDRKMMAEKMLCEHKINKLIKNFVTWRMFVFHFAHSHTQTHTLIRCGPVLMCVCCSLSWINAVNPSITNAKSIIFIVNIYQSLNKTSESIKSREREWDKKRKREHITKWVMPWVLNVYKSIEQTSNSV